MFFPIQLGVNLDFISSLQFDKIPSSKLPDLYKLTHLVAQGGADHIIMNLVRHKSFLKSDIIQLKKNSQLPLVFEISLKPDMITIAKKFKPSWVYIISDKKMKSTGSFGVNIKSQKKSIKTVIEKLQPLGIEVSVFIEPDVQQIRAAFDVGADAIELNTGYWVELKGSKKEKEWQRLLAAASYADSLGLSVHAGRGLDYDHIRYLKDMPYVRAINVGHSIVSTSLEVGMKEAVRKMVKLLK